jgi:ribA/ribD-fused uncharacterized protein
VSLGVSRHLCDKALSEYPWYNESMDTHSTTTIDKFEGENFFLSNFSPSPMRITLLGKAWDFATGEHAFQVAKIASSPWSDERKLAWVTEMSQTSSPNDAKYMGRSIDIDPARWDQIAYRSMVRTQEVKYEQNPDLKQRLLATGAATLIEGNRHGDRIWGQVNGVGKNQLGVILMDLRKEFVLDELLASVWDVLDARQEIEKTATDEEQRNFVELDNLHNKFASYMKAAGAKYDFGTPSSPNSQLFGNQR